MSIQKTILRVAAGAALGTLLSTAAMAASIPVGTYPSAGSPDFFYITSGTPFSPLITADFGATESGGAFDDSFTFTIPQFGTGSGSLSTSFASSALDVGITDVKINGTSYTVADLASPGVSGIPITAYSLNTIEVIGNGKGTYDGTATFAASAAPEPAIWALMIAGMGGMGLMLRRAKKTLGFGHAATA